MIVSCSEGERGTLDVPLQRTFTGPRSVLSNNIASISCKDLDPFDLLERMNFHLGTSYTLEPSRKSLLERALHYSCDFGVAYALLRPNRVTRIAALLIVGPSHPGLQNGLYQIPRATIDRV